MLRFVDHGEKATATVGAALAERAYGGVLIGASVRTDPHELTLFENLFNIVHGQAPQARICFNIGPRDFGGAAKRWV